jgi:tRNA(Ile)-lysidine synthase TilS/MesJ
MTCACGAPAISERGLCETHFSAWLEDAVHRTIAEFAMIRDGERVCVAASGGKDSLTLLKILAPRYAVHAVTIDEGIAGYREHTLADLEAFCAKEGITLTVKRFKDERGKTLDEAGGKHPCTQCGIWRRELLAESSQGFDVIATGHNLDDEAQAVLMNLCKHHAMKPRPVLPAAGTFVRRVKPLYFIPEADVRRYAFIHGLVSTFVECPNAAKSHRRAIQHLMEAQERREPGSKERLLRTYLATLGEHAIDA